MLQILPVVRAFVVLAALIFCSSPTYAASVTLTWNPALATGLAGYRLAYGTTSHSYPTSVIVGANVTSATVPNLQPGVTYYFAVATRTIAGLESAYSGEVAYTVPPPSLPTVSVVAGANAAEPSNLGSFLFTRTGDVRKTLTVFFTLDGDAQPGVDYKNPGNKLIFRAGRTNATVWIRPIADRVFEGAKTVVLSLADATNLDISSLNAASILIGDDDRPRISISASRNPSTSNLQTHVLAAAYTNFSLLLQSSTNLTNWTVVAAPPLEQSVAYLDSNPTGPPPRFYRAIYVRGEITEATIAEALAHQMFSANLVGVVNVELQPGWNLAANPLDGRTTDGPLGNLPDGMVFVPFKSTRVNNYEAGKWSRGVPLSRSTAGGWLYNPSNTPVNITYVGEVPALASKPQLPAGWSVRSSVTSTIVGDDTLLGYPLHAGDALYEFNPAATGTNLWIAHVRGVDGWDVPPVLTAGQGTLIYKTKNTRAIMPVTPAPPSPNLVKFIPVGQ